jgi:hypothetical protein
VIVYWRAGERQRSQQRADEIDLAVAQGRDAAEAALGGPEVDRRPFDQR